MSPTRTNRLAWALAVAFAADRLAKAAAVGHFFRRVPPKPPTWPTVTLLQPVTRGANLPATLEARGRLAYPAPIQYLFVCDAHDAESQAVCRAWQATFPACAAQVILVNAAGKQAAPKTRKLVAGLAAATGAVVCCIDDDVAPRPDALCVLVPYLYTPRAGAVFGLACYTRWGNGPTSLMSAFVNAYALLSYIPLTYLTAPFTVTGHLFALRRTTLAAIGGFSGMEDQIGDDHEIARRLHRRGLRSVQTPLIYDVENDFADWRAYAVQMKRWFVFPRQALLPYLTARQQAIALLGSLGNLAPGLLAVLALLTRRRAAVGALGLSLALFAAIYAAGEARYLQRRTPLRSWPAVLAVALLQPAQIIAALLTDNTVEWRGKRIRVLRGGTYEEVIPLSLRQRPQ
ncbi:MAG: glycosyltransferase [Chloroflexota bacterium]|nr:glycosyltransferase [Chloroflexota bacterium]